MISTQELLEGFARNLNIIQQQTKGLSHEQCLLQPPFRGNCMNWVLGHMAETRNSLLKTLGQEPILTQQECARYGHGSEPVGADGQGAIELERLLHLLQQSQERLAVALPRLTAEDLARKVKDHRGEVPLGNRLFFLYFHETYHTGQTELLRALAGKTDKVI